MAEDPEFLLQFMGGNERLGGHFIFPVGFFIWTCCIFFCRLGILVAGFLGPCRSFLGMVAILSGSILPASERRR